MSGDTPSLPEVRSMREALDLIVSAPENRWHSREWMREVAKQGLVASETETRWIPVSERLPEGLGEVLVATNSGKVVSARSAKWVRSLWDEVARGDDKVCAITHWQPMPAAPIEEAGVLDHVNLGSLGK